MNEIFHARKNYPNKNEKLSNKYFTFPQQICLYVFMSKTHHVFMPNITYSFHVYKCLVKKP